MAAVGIGRLMDPVLRSEDETCFFLLVFHGERDFVILFCEADQILFFFRAHGLGVSKKTHLRGSIEVVVRVPPSQKPRSCRHRRPCARGCGKALRVRTGSPVGALPESEPFAQETLGAQSGWRGDRRVDGCGHCLERKRLCKHVFRC